MPSGAPGLGLPPPELSQGNIGAAGVSPRGAPFGLTVANQDHVVSGGRRFHWVAQVQSEPSRESASVGPQLPGGKGIDGERSVRTRSTIRHSSITPSWRAK